MRSAWGDYLTPHLPTRTVVPAIAPASARGTPVVAARFGVHPWLPAHLAHDHHPDAPAPRDGDDDPAELSKMHRERPGRGFGPFRSSSGGRSGPNRAYRRLSGGSESVRSGW